jgi:uncharacterized membrane protein
MTLLILGIILWWAAHLFKRMLPDARMALTDKLGDASKGLFAAAIAVSVILMIFGYRMADVTVLYSLPAWAGYLNNVLMIIAIFLFGVGSKGSWLGARLRHPMLISMKIWAVAHLLVNGDTASIVLFGSMLLWAVVTVIAINTSEAEWTPDHSVAFGKRDISLIVTWTILFIIIAAVHIWLGHNPFLGKY